MTRPWILILLLAAFGVAAPPDSALYHGQKRTPTLAILPFNNSNEQAATSGYGQAVAAMLQTHMKNQTNFLVLERSQIARIVSEQTLQATGLSDAQRLELGRLYSVEAILLGEVAQFQGTIQIDARLISATTGQILVAEFAQVEGNTQLRQAVGKLAETIELKYLRRWMGDLVVSVLPVEGEVYLDDQFMGKATLNEPLKLRNMLEGTYSLRVMAGGYRTQEEKIAIQPKTVREAQIVLKSLPGTLRLISEPPGASVFLNSKPVGTTPLELDTIPEGQYQLTMSRPSFQNWERKIDVKSGQQTEVKGILKILTGQIAIRSVPAGASVYINDQLMGKTPLLVDNVTPGTIPLRIGHPRYAPRFDAVVVKPGEETRVDAPLSKLTGRLTIVPGSNGVKANIIDADGRLVAEREAPFHRLELDIGEYTVELDKPLHFRETMKVTVDEDKESRLEVAMRKKPARLTFVTGGHPADIYVDGLYFGKDQLAEGRVQEGRHVVEAVGFFGSERREVEVAPDERREVAVRAKSVQPTRWLIPLGALLTASILIGASR